VRVSAETVRRWLPLLGWRWKRAKLAAKDNDPERTAKLAAIRLAVETLQPRQALLFVDELDIALLPKTGYQWMPKGTQTEVLTPGQNEKHYLAGGLGCPHRRHSLLFRGAQNKRALSPAARYAPEPLSGSTLRPGLHCGR
jgi:hypothetical protein